MHLLDTPPCPPTLQGIANGSLTVGDAVLFVTLMQQLYGPLNFFGTCELSCLQGECAALAARGGPAWPAGFGRSPGWPAAMAAHRWDPPAAQAAA